MSPRSFSPRGETFLLPAGEKKSRWATDRAGEEITRRRWIGIGRAALDSRFSLLFSLFFLSQLIPPVIGHQSLKSTVTARQRSTMVEINCYRLISSGNGAETAQAVPPGSGRSAFRSAGGLVHTAHIGWYDLKRRTLETILSI
ncbi:hypothetical protein BHE74_00002475 [Ensete ventricosum]|nr:hypothetical protein BHE74_00002475 [Ensete ventricosum]